MVPDRQRRERNRRHLPSGVVEGDGWLAKLGFILRARLMQILFF